MDTISKKRTSSESNNDEKTNEDSETCFQGEGNSKREKFDSLSETMLQDLPFESLQCILVEAVVLEVSGLKLAKSVWKEKADLVINRLRTVCSQWTNILTTKSFRTKLHRILDNTAQTIRLEILHKSPISSTKVLLTTLKNETFMLHKTADGDNVINVYDHNDLVTVKDVIPLPTSCPLYMTGCNVSNCLYAIFEDTIYYDLSVFRISRDSDAEGKFDISPWENDHKGSIDKLRISANGSIMILSGNGMNPAGVSIYNANGSLQREIMFSLDGFFIVQTYLLQESTGNLVLSYAVNYRTRLLVIDMSGRQRALLHEFGLGTIVVLADNCDRIIISDPSNGIQLLDSELNLLGLYSLQQDVSKFIHYFDFRYDSERNEIACFGEDENRQSNVMTSFRFTEE